MDIRTCSTLNDTESRVADVGNIVGLAEGLAVGRTVGTALVGRAVGACGISVGALTVQNAMLLMVGARLGEMLGVGKAVVKAEGGGFTIGGRYSESSSPMLTSPGWQEVGIMMEVVYAPVQVASAKWFRRGLPECMCEM